MTPAATKKLIERTLVGRGILTTGTIFYVSSTSASKSDTSGAGRDSTAPFATLGYAITQVTASVGDVIVLMPGHAETVSTAAFITQSVAGLTIIGVGVGANRPTFTWSATASQIILSGANQMWVNCRFDFTGIDAVVAGFSITAADVSFVDCESTCNAAAAGVVQAFVGNATATRLKFENCRFLGPATNSGTTTTAHIDLEAGTDYIITGCYFTGKMTQAITNGAAILRGLIDSNRFVVATGTKAINMHASSTPFITNNRIHVPSGTAPIVAAAGFVAGNVYSAAAGVTAGTASTI